MLSPEEDQIDELESAYRFQMRIAMNHHNGYEIATKALRRAHSLNLAAHQLRVGLVMARFREDSDK